ncbi:MAG: 4'-phosphopantetheinyl transferase superfamily protein [Firmicutes bacterium]|nr:4'-phosphopantetheinyl transferase superfamily protein [Bacillota bacterium]
MLEVSAVDVRTLEDPALFDTWYRQMPPQRAKSIDRYKQGLNQRQSLGAGILLHEALLAHGLSDRDIEIGPFGKPYLKDQPLHFNLSHSAHLAVCILSDQPSGIDIQQVRAFKPALIKRVFLPEEMEGVSRFAQKNAPLDAACTLLWSAKESVMKCLGYGFRLSPLSIRISADFRKASIDSADSADWIASNDSSGLNGLMDTNDSNASAKPETNKSETNRNLHLHTELVTDSSGETYALALCVETRGESACPAPDISWLNL